MSSVLVLDASAAVRAVMDAASQPRLLDALASASAVIAPALLRIEVANALWKYVRTGVIDAAEARARHAEANLLVQAYIEEGPLFPEALQLAIDHQHPVYDAVYAVVARRQAARLLSFDKRLQSLCAVAGIECEALC